MWISDFINLFFPEVCMGCDRSLTTGEQIICTTCRSEIPMALTHLDKDDKVKELFFARVNVETATSLFYYEKIGVVQQLIHHLKYRGHEEVSSFLGKWMAAELQNDPAFQDIDLVIPVPVHPKRRAKRGYNQVDGFGKELAAALGSRFRESVLIKKRNTINQAQLGQVKRSDETQSPYDLVEKIEPGTHVLLVDDVITTGTTLALCAKELHKNPDIKISIVTMAISV
ncbi:ComF family protein [Nonlabens dokdonensis]|uniref:ComF family protein n=1 Tax=Nonlabens dokdonensis TaxID=328515 RepID=A0ABX5Q3C5_9FLAO|nr:ComF family protein [Nonlabens dokdonensis]